MKARAAKPAPTRAPAWVLGLLLLAAAVFYAPVRSFRFVYQDDDLLLLEQQDFVRQPANVLASFGREMNQDHRPDVYYRPLVNASLVLDYQLYGAWQGGYRLTNLVLHLLAALMVWQLMGWARLPLAWRGLVLAVFLVHPAAANAVGFITSRNEQLLLLFALLALWALRRWLQHGHWGMLALQPVWVFCAFCSKETAVGLPPALAAWAVLVHGTRPFSARLLLPAAGWVLAAGAWALGRHLAFTDDVALPVSGLLASAAQNLVGVLLYAGHAVVAFSTEVFLPLRSAYPVVGAAVLLGVSALALSQWRRTPRPAPNSAPRWALWGVVWFLCFIGPVLVVPASLGDLRYISNRTYVPMPGLWLALGLLVAPVAGAQYQRAVLAGGLVLVLATGWVGQKKLWLFSDKYRFWERQNRDVPNNAFVMYKLGYVYQVDGRLNEAEHWYRQAYALDPSLPNLAYLMGVAFSTATTCPTRKPPSRPP